MAFEHSEEQQEKVMGWVEKWKPRLFLHQWTLNLYYINSPYWKDPKTMLRVASNWKYHEADIYVYPYLWSEEHAEEYREKSVVHELCHTLLDMMKDLVEALREGSLVTEKQKTDADEYITEWIANIIWTLSKQ